MQFQPRLQDLIPTYLKVYSQFITSITDVCPSTTNLNQKLIAQTAVFQMKCFIAGIGAIIQEPKLWDAVTLCICELFESTVPKGLMEEKKRFNS